MPAELKSFPPRACELSFGDRIVMVLREQRRSKVWLSEQLRISKQNLNYLLRHSCKPKYISDISSCLNLQEKWLIDGNGPKNRDSQVGFREIPVLPMLLNQDNDLEQPAKKTTLVGGKHLDPACFAIRLTNASMDPAFQSGTFLIFNPNSLPQDADFVCLSLKQQNGVFVSADSY